MIRFKMIHRMWRLQRWERTKTLRKLEDLTDSRLIDRIYRDRLVTKTVLPGTLRGRI